MSDLAKKLTEFVQFSWPEGLRYYCGGMFYTISWICENSGTIYAFDCGGERQYWAGNPPAGAYPILDDRSTQGVLFGMLVKAIGDYPRDEATAMDLIMDNWISGRTYGEALARTLITEWSSAG